MKKSPLLVKAMYYVNKLLLPLDSLYYHKYSHSLEVMKRAMYLGEKENLSDEDIDILGFAWLFHDTWFVIQYDQNEEIGARIARNYLQINWITTGKIETIQRLILATKPEYTTPEDILEKIIKDADLDNLWRNDFFEKKDKLKHEIESIKKIKIIEPEWNHASLILMKEYNYYTKTQQRERGKKKEENKKILENIIKEYKENI